MLVMLFGVVGLLMSLMYYKSWSHHFCSYQILAFFIGILGYSEGWYFFNFSMGLSLDLLSWSLSYLTMFISSLMMMASVLIFVNKSFIIEFCTVVGLLTLSLILVFLVGDLLWFYVFFEGSLIPTLFLISGWGYQPERLKAGIYLFFYTMTGSLPLLLSVFFIFNMTSSLSFHLFSFEMCFNIFLCVGMMAAFLVKMPMFFTHLWLPKAHVEAPISGSMVLAGILLKLGGYGIFRVISLFYMEVMFIGKVLLTLSLWGGILLSLLCLRQFDLKSLIAYSSVVHMGMVVGGLMVMSSWGAQGVIVLMIGHGLCSSGMFAAANILYERGATRSMLMNSGMIVLFPGFMLWWFLLSVSNMAAPPSLNLLGEISLMISLVSWSTGLCMLLALLSFFSAAYSLYLFSLVNHGKPILGFGGLEVKSREYMLIILHWIPLNILVASGDLLMCWG